MFILVGILLYCFYNILILGPLSIPNIVILCLCQHLDLRISLTHKIET